jgi:hypothetical protein
MGLAAQKLRSMVTDCQVNGLVEDAFTELFNHNKYKAEGEALHYWRVLVVRW